MLASQRIASGETAISMNTFVESQFFPEAYRGTNYPPLPFVTRPDYPWAEQRFSAGDITAVAAYYKNIPPSRQDELNQLVSETYRKKLITVPFLEASLLLLGSGVLPEFQSLGKRLEHLCPAGCSGFEQQRAIDFVTDRTPNDIVAMVLRSDRLIATMTLFPFNRKNDIPSLSYLDVGSGFELLPDGPGLEVGRLAKINCSGYHLNGQKTSFVDMASIAAAFVVSERFVTKTGILSEPDSFICGDTHGTLISSLSRFFPLQISDSRINPDMLDDDSDVRGMSSHFIQRQVLGSFDTANDLLSAVRKVADSDPDRAHRIKGLLDSGLDSLGISSIHQFDPQRFRVHFFHFPFHHPKTRGGLAKMAKMIRWTASRPERPKRVLN